MSESEDAGKYQVDNNGPVQGQIIGDHATVNQHFLTTTQPDRVQDQNRQRFLTYLSTRYRDVLEQSLQGIALLTLGLRTKPEAIAHLAPLVFRHLNQSERVLSPGTSLTEVYDQAGGDLLILGEPGAGKSTLLVHLAQGLLTRAERDKEHLLPVIFNLSSWAQKRHSLDEWLVEELLVSYQVPRKVGKLWVQEGCLLALFDGLDEVALSARGLCIDAINTYRKDHLVPLVVCSRTTEYFSQEHRLVLQNAVVVQPLTTEQIDDYLEMAGSGLAAVRTTLQNNQVLRELATSPLMLNVLTLTYQGSSMHALPISGSAEEQQHEVFASYIKRMLATNETAQHTRLQQMLSWLSWLARQMQQHSQTVFYLEQLQSSWLSHERLMQIYEFWAVRFPAIFMGVLLSIIACKTFFGEREFPDFILHLFLGGFLGAILSRGSVSDLPSAHIKHPLGIRRSAECLAKTGSWESKTGSPLLRRLIIGVLVGASIGLSVGITFGLRIGICLGLSLGLSTLLLQILLRTSSQVSSPPTISQKLRGFSWRHLIKRMEIYNGMVVGLLVGLSFGLSTALNYGLVYGLISGLLYGLSFGLVGGFLSVLLVGRSSEIRPADRLVWSWKYLGKSLFSIWHISIMLGISILIGLAIGLIDGLIDGLIGGPSIGLSYWLLLGLFQGIASETIENHKRIVPNQGIRHSLSNGLILGLVSAAIIGLASFLIPGLIWRLNGLRYGPSIGLVMIPSTGLLVGLLNGGLVYLRHYTLRFLLWREGSIPWRLPQLLDEAARHILLRKIGGGYVFIHRLFLDYMASLETSSPLPLETSEQQTSHQSIDNNNEEHEAI